MIRTIVVSSLGLFSGLLLMCTGRGQVHGEQASPTIPVMYARGAVSAPAYFAGLRLGNPRVALRDGLGIRNGAINAGELDEPIASGAYKADADRGGEYGHHDVEKRGAASRDDRERSRDDGLELTPELTALREKVRRCLAVYYHRPENAAARSPWGIMHALIAYGVDTEIYAGGRKVNAIAWLCWNGPCRGQRLFYVQNGKLHARQGPGLQGHPGQFLAMLAQAKVMTDYPIHVDGHEFTVADLIEHEKLTCQAGTELTFKLIALAHYLKSDETWKNQQGERWSIPRLIREELAQPIVGATCGGAHRMTGFSYAVRKREQRGESFEGEWLRAKRFVDAYHEWTFKLQNPDGSFSTNWFAGREDWGGPDRRLETTGHILEWLVYSLPQDQLCDPRVVKAVDYLAGLLLDGAGRRWEIGSQGHALHALAIYDERLFGGRPGQRGVELAGSLLGARAKE